MKINKEKKKNNNKFKINKRKVISFKKWINLKIGPDYVQQEGHNLPSYSI